MQSHGARIALLADDMADADPGALDRAIRRWVNAKPYLPKASELRALIADERDRRPVMIEGGRDGSYAQALADQRNAQLTRDDIEWFVAPNGEVLLRDKPHWTARRTRELADAAERDRRQFNHRQAYRAYSRPQGPHGFAGAKG